MYAFRQYEISIDGAEIEEEDVSEELESDIPEDYLFLGFDAVSRSCDNAFECSPLSCNHGAEKMKCNPYCLFDAFDEAISGAKEFSVGGWEPGPYYVVEVYRKKRSEPASGGNA